MATDLMEIAVNTTDAVLVPLLNKLRHGGDSKGAEEEEPEVSPESLRFAEAKMMRRMSLESFWAKVDMLPASSKVRRFLLQCKGKETQPPSLLVEDQAVKYDAFVLLVFYLVRINPAVRAIRLIKCHLHRPHAVALAWALPRLKELSSLELSGNGGLKNASTQALALGLKRCESLESLTLRDGSIRDTRGLIGREVVPNCPALERLDLANNKIGPRCCQALGAGLRKTTSLKSINLHNNRLRDLGCVALMAGLGHNDTVVTVDLGKNGFTQEAGPAIGTVLANNNTLGTLELHRNNLEDGVVDLAEGLRENESLFSLRLNQNGLSADAARALGDALADNQSLKYLYIQDNVINDDGFIHFMDALLRRSELAYVDASRNRLDDQCCAVMADVLHDNCKLETLVLDGNMITSEGAKLIAEGLTNNSTLTKLSLANNTIGHEGSEALGYVLANNDNTTLKVLALDENPIGKQPEEGWVGRANLRGFTGPSEVALNITIHGHEIASNSLKTFGVTISNSETRTGFSRSMLLTTVLTNWFDLITDALVVSELYYTASELGISYAWFAFSLAFLVFPTLYMMVFMSSPAYPSGDPAQERRETALNALLSLLQLRIAYEAYQSYRYSETTSRLISIRVVEVAGESGPQSFLQINFIIYALLRQSMAGVDVRSTAVIISVVLSLIVLGQTFSDLFERRFIFRHTKHVDSLQLFVRLIPCWIFHICQFSSRALTIAIGITIFKPYIAAAVLVLAILLRVLIWKATKSERSIVFAFLVTFLANSAWDTMPGVVLGLGLSTLEAAGAVAGFWWFAENRGADAPDSWLWNEGITFDSLPPLAMLQIMGSLWAIYTFIFVVWIFPHHEYRSWGSSLGTKAGGNLMVPTLSQADLLDSDAAAPVGGSATDLEAGKSDRALAPAAGATDAAAARAAALRAAMAEDEDEDEEFDSDEDNPDDWTFRYERFAPSDDDRDSEDDEEDDAATWYH